MPQSPDIGQNSNGGISDFQISGQPFIEENCHNSRTSNDIDVKLGPVTKLEKKITTIPKKSDDGVTSKFVTSLSFFGFMVNLEQFESWGPYLCSVKLTFSSTVTFYLTKTGNRSIEPLTQLSY